MKFSVINATVLCFAALSIAAPLMNTDDISDLAERDIEIDDFDVREWFDLEPRTGNFHVAAPNVKKAAHSFINSARKGGQLSRASAGGSSARTTKADGTFHLDRQQPTNAHGSHKVAVQLNKVGKGKPSTVGQVAIHGGHQPSGGRVAKALKHSVRTGKETHINHPNSKKAKNIAHNKAQTGCKGGPQPGQAEGWQPQGLPGYLQEGQEIN
ncbi:hypothetical protein NLJ89_g4952 [Agrocybe chaxingu]|uniref:Uncharacterized protein n=1 Tax=Agrocybe chaxingu TaxID=84603 RepID=A0A9W8K273_9AGAR|nr:hypothetical protein NLJ89_g4952 [Agrocybe chaxingu]